jgi:uncharacterized protein YjbI with pentapeptide repeats
MTSPRRLPRSASERRRLTVEDTRSLQRQLRSGRLKRVEAVECPLDVSVDVSNLDGVEFVGSKLWLTVAGGLFNRAVMRDCHFVDCDLDALRVRKADVVRTTFERVELGGTAMGGFYDARMEEVAFSDCQLRDHAITRCVLKGFVLVGGSFDSNIMHTSVTNSQFQTQLDRLNIVGCDFQNADMSESTVGQIAILDWRGTDLKLPRGRNGFLLSTQNARAVVQRILPALSSSTREHLLGLLGDDDLHLVISEAWLRRELGASDLETKALVDILLEQAPRSLADLQQLSSLK